MFKNKNKGFTMVELLATVTILGILATIATVSVTRTMQKAHKEYDQKQNKLFTTAAQTYFTDNRSALPKKLLTTSEVTLQELIDKNYIEEIVDYKKKAYDKKNSKAYVKKTGAGKYIYYSVLVGSDGREIKDNLENKKSDDIKTVIGAPDLKNTDMQKEPFTESDKTIYYVNKQITIPIKLSSTIGISSYQYKINKLSSITAPGKKYKTSGEIAIDATSFIDTISINAKDFANGIYQLEIDAYGYQAEVSPTTASYIIVIDKTKPKCTISVDGTTGNKVDGTNLYWYKNGNLTATIDITEQNKYQYALGVTGANTNLTYYKNTTRIETKKFNDNIVGKKLNGYVIDKAGNEGKCETAKKIYYDPIPPTCESSGGTDKIDGNIDGFVNFNVTISGVCKDENGSGCKQASVTKSFSESQKQEETPGKVEDKAGNEATCPNVKVYIDKTAPRCIPTFDDAWHSSNFNVSATCSDNENGVGCEKTNYSSLVTLGSDVEGTATDTSITVSDKLGNKKQCEIAYKYDTKAPECVSSGGSDSWTNGSITLKGTCSDSGSGCTGHATKLFNTEGSWTNQSPGIVKDNVGHETTCRANQTVKIDKPPPTCPTITADKTAKSWMKSSVTLTFSNFTTDSSTYDWYTNVDADKKNTFTKNSSNNISTTTKTISADGKRIGKLIVYDLAGNPSSDCFTDEFWIDTIGPNISLEVKNIYDAFSKSGCGTNANCTLLYETTIANKKTVYHGVTLEADNECDKNISCSPIADWGAQAKYEKGGTGCNWGDGIDYTWAGAAVCTTAGSGRVKRCYKVKDSAGNTSAKICSCQENDKTVNLKEPNQCF